MNHPSSPLEHSGPTSAGAHPTNVRPQPAEARTTSIASILRPSSAAAAADGDGPYFDLEFTIPKDKGEDDTDSTVGSDCEDRIRSGILITTSSKPQFASALLKSATKLRVFMLRFRKSKSATFDAADSSQKKENSKILVKFRVEALSRDTTPQSPALKCDEKKVHTKDVIHKYLNKIKPLYNRASKRHGDKHRFSGQITVSSDSTGMKTVSKRLRKSRSASAAVAAVRSPPVIQQEDVIESAIAHCKRSFNAGKAADFGLARCRSDPGAERDVIN